MKRRFKPRRPAVSWAQSYRIPMAVEEIHLFRDEDTYPVCPRCHLTMEREYQSYCDRCGQALSWKGYSKARVVTMR